MTLHEWCTVRLLDGTHDGMEAVLTRLSRSCGVLLTMVAMTLREWCTVQLLGSAHDDMEVGICVPIQWLHAYTGLRCNRHCMFLQRLATCPLV